MLIFSLLRFYLYVRYQMKVNPSEHHSIFSAHIKYIFALFPQMTPISTAGIIRYNGSIFCQRFNKGCLFFGIRFTVFSQYIMKPSLGSCYGLPPIFLYPKWIHQWTTSIPHEFSNHKPCQQKSLSKAFIDIINGLFQSIPYFLLHIL